MAIPMSTKFHSGGISLRPDTGFTPVIIDVLKNNGNSTVAEIISAKVKKKEKKHGLYYRIPEYADARILFKDVVLASKKLLISQFGSVMSLPQKAINGRRTSLEFYPDYGSIKSLQQKGHRKKHLFGH